MSEPFKAFRCSKCGQPTGTMGLCDNCAQKASIASINNNNASARSSSSSSSSGSSGGFTGSTEKRPLWALIVCCLLVISLITGIITYIKYNAAEKELWEEPAVAEMTSRSAEAYENYLLGSDDESALWSIRCTTRKSGFIAYMLPKGQKSYYISCSSVNGITSYRFTFEGENLGTGLADGEYVLTTLEGVQVLIDTEEKLIYKKGTQRYDSCADKLKAITHDGIYNELFAKVSGGEHGTNGTDSLPREFVRKDKATVYSYMLEKEPTKVSGGQVEAVVEHSEGKLRDVYRFSYSDSASELDLEGYSYYDENADAADQTQLEKLFATTERAGGMLTWFENDEAVLRVTVDVFPDGYEFKFRDEGTSFEKNAIYRVNTTDKTLTKITENDNGDEVETKMPLSKHQKDYDYLLTLVPETYIANIMDMSKAEEKSGFLGIEKKYVMTDDSGTVIAELATSSGKLKGMYHYISETERVEIGLK